jgi:hypothetical protein
MNLQLADNFHLYQLIIIIIFGCCYKLMKTDLKEVINHFKNKYNDYKSKNN